MRGELARFVRWDDKGPLTRRRFWPSGLRSAALLNAALLSATLLTGTTAAQDGAVEQSFVNLQKDVAAAAAGGATAAEQSRRYADWMVANDWRRLSFGSELRLLAGLERDSANKGGVEESLSVRWTGFLTAPADGNYRLEQLRNYYYDEERETVTP